MVKQEGFSKLRTSFLEIFALQGSDKQNDKAHLSRSSVTLSPKTAALTPSVTQARRTSALTFRLVSN